MRITFTRAESTDPARPVKPTVYFYREPTVASGQWFNASRLNESPDFKNTSPAFLIAGGKNNGGRVSVNPYWWPVGDGYVTFYGTIEVEGKQIQGIFCQGDTTWYCPEKFHDGITAEPDNDEVWIQNGVLHFALHAKNVNNSDGRVDLFDFWWDGPPPSTQSSVRSFSSARSSVVSSRITSSTRSVSKSCFGTDTCIPAGACHDKGGMLKDPGACTPGSGVAAQIAPSDYWCCQLPTSQSSVRASSVGSVSKSCLGTDICIPYEACMDKGGMLKDPGACTPGSGVAAQVAPSGHWCCQLPGSQSSARSSLRSSVRSSSRVSSVRSSQRSSVSSATVVSSAQKSSATSVVVPFGRIRVTITRAESTDPTYPVQSIIYLPDETVMAPGGQWFRLPPTPDMYSPVRGISMMGTGDGRGRFSVNPSDFRNRYVGYVTLYGTIEVAGTEFTAITCPEGVWYCPELYRDGITAEPDNDEVWIEDGVIHFAIHAKNVHNSEGSLDQFDFSWTVQGSASSVRSTFNGSLCPDANGVFDPSCKPVMPLPSPPFFMPSQWGGSLLSVAGTAPAGFIVLVVMLAGLIGGFLYRRRR